jgi:hypothetical protein
MKSRQILVLSLLIIKMSCFGQSGKSDNEISMIERHGILFGAHISQFPTLEIGYSKYSYTPENTKMPFGGGYSLSVENYFLNNNYLMAPKVAFWANFIALNFGASIPWYTNFEGGSSLKLRPELGIGYENWRGTVAYNLPVYNNRLRSIPDIMLSLNYIVPLTKPKQ